MVSLRCSRLLTFSLCILGASAVASLPAPSAFAQTISGDAVGVVKDVSGAQIAGAKITITNVATGVTFPAIANAQGEYRVPNLPPGKYTVEASAPGFATSKLENVSVQLNQTVTADLTLKVSSSTTIEVTSEAAVSIDTTTSQLQTTFETKEVQDMPVATVGLGVINLSLLSPGVSSSGGTGIGVGPAIGGQRPQNNDFTIEGIDNNNKTVSGPQVQVNNDAIAQFTLLTNVYSAEYGHSDAGHFNTIVTSGTNSIHGRAYEYFQNRDLNAVDFALVRGGGASKNPRYDNNRYGGGVGGPIKKDKLFYFADYERQPIGQAAAPLTLCVPTADGKTALAGAAGLSATNVGIFNKYVPSATGADTAGVCPAGSQIVVGTSNTPVALGDYTLIAPLFTNNDFLTTAIDYTMSEKDSFRFRYIYYLNDTIDTAAQLPVFWGAVPNRNHLFVASNFHTFGPTLTNEFRVGYNRNYSTVPAPFPEEFPGLNTFPNLQLNDLNFLQIGPDPNAPSGGVQNTYQVVDNINWIKGKHSLKFGFDGRKYISPQYFTQRVRGDYEYTTSQLYFTDQVPDYLGERDATPTGAIPTDYCDATAFSGFVQDDFRIAPTFTLNMGVRYEFQSIPFVTKQQRLNAAASVPGLIEFKEPKPQMKNFGPRIGFAYAPTPDTSIRAGFAIGYDQIRDNLAENTAPPDVAVTEDVGSSTTAPFLANGALPAVAALGTVEERRAASSSYSPDQRVPYSESWSLGVQHVFLKDYTAEVRYLGNHALHLVTQDRINRQPVVTPSYHLPTYFSLPGNGELAKQTLTLDDIQTSAANGANFVPAFFNAGFNTGNIVAYNSRGFSNYNGLAAQLTRRFSKGLLLNFSYTWSKTMDNSTADVFSTYLTPRRPQNGRDFNADYSRSALDHTHRITLAAVYDMPFFQNGNFLERNLFSNWEIAPIYTYESPEYATPQSGLDSNLNGDSAGDRTVINTHGTRGTAATVVPVVSPSLVSACPADTTDPAANGPANGGSYPACSADIVGYVAGTITPGGTGAELAGATFTPNPDAYYVQAGSGALANGGRNTLPTRPINNFDATAVKRISITERYKVEFQAQAFNVFNHPQFIPGFLDTANTFTTATSSGYQGFVSVSSGIFNNPRQSFGSNPRTMQLVLKFIF